jgi:hypothetical protein
MLKKLLSASIIACCILYSGSHTQAQPTSLTKDNKAESVLEQQHRLGDPNAPSRPDTMGQPQPYFSPRGTAIRVARIHAVAIVTCPHLCVHIQS